MTEWKECTLSELGMIVGGATPSTKVTENYENGVIPWITPKDLSQHRNRYISHGERNISERGLSSCSTRMMPKGTILFSSRAPIGYVAIATQSVCTNQGFKSIVPNDNVDSMFIYYLLKYEKDAIESLGSGTTFKEVSGNTMKNFVVTVPVKREVQSKIASILGTLDDKIELNERINDNLEQQIFALYHSKYQYPSSNNCWHDGCVGDVVTLQRGYDLPKDKIINGVYPVVGSTNTVAYHRDFTTEPPCIIMGRSGNIGKPRLYLQRCWAHNTTLFSKEFRDSNPFWVYATLCSIDYGQFRGGSAVPTLNRNHVHKYPLAIPSKKLQDEFGEFALVLYSMISKNIVQNEKLNALRNALLPKLMSGEIDVSNIDL
ncbi:MAG: restriction endonuclease subunit S [Lachnospiraceae bacterium]|nr:restriction endonuclease subunit S [Lachnospiraceae bacterium]